MSQLDFAALFDLKRGTLGAYEEGRSEPKIDTIIKVSEYFNLSTDQLLTGELTVNQLLNFSTDILEKVDAKEGSNIISIPLVNDANIHSILTESWNESLLTNATHVDLPLAKASSIAFQQHPQLSMQYTTLAMQPSDILFASEVDAAADDTSPTTYIALYMKQLLVIDGKLAHGTIHSALTPPIDTADCAKVWQVTATLSTHYQPPKSDTILSRLAALEQEVERLKK